MKIVCYQSCKCCLHLIKSSIQSIEENNPDVCFFIFNNKINHFFNDGTSEKTEEFEYSKEDLKEIKSLCKRMVVVNNWRWMDIFDECPTKKEQTNTFSRLTFPRFLQKLNANEEIKRKLNEFFNERPLKEKLEKIDQNPLYNEIIKDKLKKSVTEKFEEIEDEKMNPKIGNIDRYVYSDEDVICDGNIDAFWNLEFGSNFFRGFKNSFAEKNKVPLFRRKPLLNDGLLLVNPNFKINDPEFIKLLNVQIFCKVIGKVVCRTQALANWFGIDEIVLTDRVFESLHESARIRQLLCLRNYHICHTDGNKNNLPVMRKIHQRLILTYNI